MKVRQGALGYSCEKGRPRVRALTEQPVLRSVVSCGTDRHY
jgi:hypothetical protein